MSLKKHKLKAKKNNQESDILLRAKLLMYMRRGLSLDDAATLLKISKYKLCALRNDPEFEDFVKTASAQCEDNHLQNIELAGKTGAWKASAWFLERKFPDKYGKKDVIKHEYEIKLLSFQKIVLDVINDVAPDLKAKILQKLRTVNTEELISEQNKQIAIEGSM
jgi:hypothetical protein